MGQVTELLKDVPNADENEKQRIIDEAIALLYKQLRQRAAWLLRNERPGLMQGTELVNDVFPSLQRIRKARNGDELLGIAVERMRKKLIDHARKRDSIKRGRGLHITYLERAVGVQDGSFNPEDRLKVDELLGVLTSGEQDLAKWRLYTALSDEEIAQLLGIERNTLESQWRVICLKLFRARKA